MKTYFAYSDVGCITILPYDGSEKVMFPNGFGDGRVKLHIGTLDEVKDREDFKDGRFVKVAELHKGDLIFSYDLQKTDEEEAFEVYSDATLYTRRGNTMAHVYIITKEAE